MPEDETTEEATETIEMTETTVETTETTETTIPQAPAPLTEDERMAIAREYVAKNPDEFSHYFTPAPSVGGKEPEDPVAAIKDEWGNVDPGKLAAYIEAKQKENANQILQGVGQMLNPVMESFATNQALSTLPEAARPYAQEIALKLKSPLYTLVADETSREIVSNAALGMALKAGKIELPEPSEPIGGGNRAGVLNDAQRANLESYAKIAGRMPSQKEVEELRASGRLG
jgi:hypothetical protein